MTDITDQIEKDEKAVSDALALIGQAIDIARPAIFIEPETAHGLDVLGILVSKYTEWTGADILRVAYAALEDANFSDEAEKVSDLYREITGDDPWS